MKGITFDEAWPGATCDDSLYGILVGGNDTLKLSNSAIVAGGAVPINGCQGGIGIQVGMAWTTPVERGHLFLTSTTVSGYQKNGVTVDGAGSTAKITYDTVEGAGPTTQTAQNGIQVSNGAYATIAHATIEGNECDVASCGANGLTDYQAGGVLFYGAKAGSSISSCVIKHNDYGVYFYSQRASLSPGVENSLKFSTVTNNRDENVLLDQGRDLIASDRILYGDVGIELLQYNGQTYGDHDSVVQLGAAALDRRGGPGALGPGGHGRLPRRGVVQVHRHLRADLSNSSSYTVTFLH